MKRVFIFWASVTLCSAHAAEKADRTSPPLRPASERWGNLQTAEDTSFRRHVIPMFSRQGCSGRECHGSFQGRGGFQLSLFGYDFEKDHKAITEGKGNEDEVRVNPQDPTQSLIITKPTMQVKHKGKERIKKDSWEYNLLLKWLLAGAKNDTAATGEFDRLEVTPGEIVFKKPGDTVQVRVLAHWKDGTVEDVTQITRFRTNDESVAAIDESGVVECKDKGDTHIVAFYDNGVQPIPVMLPVSDKNGSRYPRVATHSKVDKLVVAKLRKVGIVPSGVCTDAEFLRRVSLDLSGTLPTPDDVTKFLADKSPTKRTTKIDELLNTPAYAAWWTTKLCDFTGNNARQLNNGGGLIRNVAGVQSRQWYDWIYKRVADNEPFDKLAAGIILGRSRSSADQSYEDFAKEMAAYFRDDHPADFAARADMPYFWQRRNVQKPEEKALAFAHTWLGVRIECAQCHKHPFDQWTKTDFEQFQAFFTAVGYGNGKSGKDETVTYASLTNEIMEKVKADRGDKPFENKKNEERQLQEKEAQRRLRAGELVPWSEVFVDIKRLGQPSKKNKQEVNGSSRVMTPKILGGEEVMLQQYNDPRQPLMDWLHSKDNPYFARAFVNRVWAAYFGRGIVEPADDMNLANPPSNRELINYLAGGFIAHSYDMKWLHREVLNSDTYQRSWRPNDTNKLDEKNFSRMVLRRLPAEVVLDAIAQATVGSEALPKMATDIEGRAIGPNANASGYGKGAKFGNEYTLTVFGKPAREVNCDCERTMDPTLLQTIYTRNDPDLLARIEAARKDQPAWIADLRKAYSTTSNANELKAARDKLAQVKQKLANMQPPRKPDGNNAKALQRYEKDLKGFNQRKQELTKRQQQLEATMPKETPKPVLDADKLVNEVFLRTVSRPPTAQELDQGRADIAAASDPVDGVRDLLWVMLNTREFIVNH